MALNEGVAIKLDAFTLLYSTLLSHLGDLDRALRRDTRDLRRRILSQADEALKRLVYESKPSDLPRAVEALALNLRSVRVSIEATNAQAARVVDDVIADIKKKAPDWHYQPEVERYRDWGERLSRLFYEGTPWSRTQERLAEVANTAFRYAGVLDTAVQGQNTYGYRVAPMAFYREYKDADGDEPQENVILVRFSFEHDFSTYLAYPFFFLHEFASHVHGANSDSDIFDDGWMMYAIHDFLVNANENLPPSYRLCGAQIQAIGEHCPAEISTAHLCSYYFLAQSFHKWSHPWAGGVFRQLTRELAGYPLEESNPFFLADFIERLRHHFEERRADLRRKIENYTSVNDLYMRLPPP